MLLSALCLGHAWANGQAAKPKGSSYMHTGAAFPTGGLGGRLERHLEGERKIVRPNVLGPPLHAYDLTKGHGNSDRIKWTYSRPKRRANPRCNAKGIM